MVPGYPATRGWVEYRRGWQLPNLILEFESNARMAENACILTSLQRQVVESQIAATCRPPRLDTSFGELPFESRPRRGYRGRRQPQENSHGPESLVNPRILKERCDTRRENWWAERGSIRYLNTDNELEAAILYVRDGQDANRYSHSTPPPAPTRSVSDGKLTPTRSVSEGHTR